MADNTNNNLTLTPEQVAERGEEVYKTKLKPILEQKEHGKFVVIHILSEDYFLGDTILEAIERARAKYPDRLFHTIRVGYQGMFKMGGYQNSTKSFLYGWNA